MANSSELFKLLSSLVSTVEEPLYVKDRGHRWVLVNDAYCKWMGLTREQLIGKMPSELFPKEFADITNEDENLLIQNNQDRESEARVADGKGNVCVIVTRHSVIRTDEGETYLMVVIRDQTRLKDAEKKLHESEQRHKVIFEKAPVGVAYLGHNGRFKEVNSRFCALMGYAPKELLGQNYGVLLHPDDPWPNALVLATLFSGATEHLRLDRKARRKDGAWLDVSVWISGVHTEGAKVGSAVVVIEDIGERKRAESMIHAQKDILELVARKMPLATITQSIVDLVSQHLEEAACMIRVWDPVAPMAVFRACPGEEVASPESLRQFPSCWARPITSTDGFPMGLFEIYSHRSGNPSPLDLELMEFGSNLAGIAMERQRSDQKILDQQVQLFSASRMVTLGEMAAGIAHEINNPLAVIHGRAGHLRSLIAQGKLDPVAFDTGIERIEATSMRIAKIIRGLRSFAREGSGDPFQPAKVAEILADALEFCRARFKNHDVDLSVEGAAPETLELDCRPVQIGQILLNLLSNAFDAVLPLPQKWVKIQLRDLGESIEFAVVDSGRGIPGAVREKIMNPFFTTKEVGKGTGLGLSIVKGIAEAHGGMIRLDPDSPNTRFVVILPKIHAAEKKAA